MKGKIRNFVLVFVVMLGLLAAFTEAPSAHAWPWTVSYTHLIDAENTQRAPILGLSAGLIALNNPG